MAYSATTVRLDSDLKKNFESVCKSMGMNANVAFNIFARAVVRENGIPFPVEASDKKNRRQLMSAFRAIRSQAESNPRPEMSEKEIEEEITSYRAENEI